MSHNATIPTRFKDQYDNLMSSANSAGRGDALNKFARYRTGTKESILEDCWVGSRFLVFLAAKRARSDSDEEKVDRALSSQNYTWNELNDSRFHSNTKGFNSGKADLVLSRLAREYQVDLLDLFLEFLNHCKDCPLAYFYTVSESEHIKIAKERDEKLTASDKRLPASTEDRAYHIKAKSEAIEKTNKFISDINQWKEEQQGIKKPDVKPSQPLPKERYATITSEDNWLSPANESFIPFVGREKEIELLDQFANWKPKEGRKNFQIWAIVGPSGAGKTRLLTHWANQDTMDDWVAIKVKSTTKIDWPLTQPTLISIDYIYGYDEFIRDLIAKIQYTELTHPVRLLLLDHAMPVTMSELLSDPRWGFEGAESDEVSQMEEHFFFKQSPLNLNIDHANKDDYQTEKNDHLLTKIICAVAFRGEEDPYKHSQSPNIQRGLQYLKDTQGAEQPLFAALVGDAIRQQNMGEAEADNYPTLNRRELVRHYLKGKTRLTWLLLERQKGTWVACFVAAATAQNGAEFEALWNTVPDANKAAIGEYFDFKVLCNAIVSGTSTNALKAFEPDILGETHFLLFLEAVKERFPDFKRHLSALLEADFGNAESKSAREFVAFITRITRNLADENQDHASTKKYWKLLGDLLVPNLFSEKSPFRWAVSMSCFEVYLMLYQKGMTELSNSHLKKVNDLDLYKLPNSEINSKNVIKAIEYFGLTAKNDECVPKLLMDLLTCFDKRPNRDYPAIMLALLAKNEAIAKMIIDRSRSLRFQEQDSGLTPLMLACVSGLEEVSLLLVKKEAYLDVQDFDGWTALMYACRYNQKRTALKLVEKNASLDVCTYEQRLTPLMIACCYNQEEVALNLIDRGVDLEARDMHGTSIPNFAYKNKLITVVSKIIERLENEAYILHSTKIPSVLWEAYDFRKRHFLMSVEDILLYPNELDKEGNTAIMAACQNFQEEIAYNLIESTENLNVRNNQEDTALILACKYNLGKVALKLAMKDVNFDQSNNNGSTALIYASKNFHVGVVHELIQKGVDTEKQDNLGWTALMYACQHDYFLIAFELALEVKDFRIKNKEGNTAYAVACIYKQEKIAIILADKNNSSEPQNNQGDSMLMLACRHGLENLARTLIQGGVNINDQNNNRDTALILACKNKIESLALMIIEKINYFDLKNKQGDSALIIACRNKLENVAFKLLEKKPDLGLKNNSGHTDLMEACVSNLERVASNIIDISSIEDLEIQDSEGMTALMFTCVNNQQSLALKLIKKTSNLDAQCSDRWTALMYTCCYEMEEVAIALIENGADLRIENAMGQTALICAIYYNQTKTVRSLLDHKVNTDQIWLSSDQNFTPLELARYYGRSEIIQMLEG